MRCILSSTDQQPNWIKIINYTFFVSNVSTFQEGRDNCQYQNTVKSCVYTQTTLYDRWGGRAFLFSSGTLFVRVFYFEMIDKKCERERERETDIVKEKADNLQTKYFNLQNVCSAAKSV